MRKSIAVALVAILAVSNGLLSGCSTRQATGSVPVGDVISSAQVSADPTEAVSAAKDEAPAVAVIDGANIAEPFAFEDEVAWVDTYDSKVLINKNGEIILDTTDLPSSNVSNFWNGSALCVPPGGNDFLFDKEGNVLWSSDEEIAAKINEVYGDGVVEDTYVNGPRLDEWRGFLVVEFDVNSFDYTGTLYGVVNAQGEWVVEPPSIAEAIEDAENGIDPGSHGGTQDGAYFEDYYLRISRVCVVLYRTGEILECTGLWDGPGTGLFYGDRNINDIEFEEVALAHSNRKYDGYGKFIDASGEVVLDISAMPLSDEGFGGNTGRIGFEEGFACSEYCIVHLENSGGGAFFTVIDRDGTQMFEPRKSGELGTLGENAFFYKSSSEDEGYFLSVDGNQLGTATGDEALPFSEGRAWIRSGEVWYCIDDQGEIVF